MKKYIPNLIGIGRLQREASKVIEEVIKSGKEAFITVHNEIKVVMLNISQYEELKKFEDNAKKQ